ncbi:uncharacterized protein B0H64DRAFT_153077 [Chaetomium fimeti]|uniref:Uncharacterized protein n=1 Tax=Chaetomium fimeti TaxID=1854472 RepID=A0AAE0HGF6_9PEZI|nr:hypothetical protein B0H64DRAFT_153077 [Chaetomium fimeti]
MLDENLPTFRLKPSSDNPHSSLLYFTQNGSEPAAEYLIRRADPALPASRSKYGIAICDPYNTDVVYGEVTVEPEWSQPTLSAAEIRAQAHVGAAPAPAMPLVPDSFTVQLYNPDQSVAVKMVTGSWGKSDTWEFELPVQTFRKPTISALDREQQDSSTAAADLIPRVMFRWKKDGLLSKDMTCYMTGQRLGARKNKEPDITIGLFKAARESILTVYQPNLHRVEIEDRKGLELVLLLASEVIKDLWLIPKPDTFNVQGGGGPALNVAKRKNSRPVVNPSPAAPVMSGALANVPPAQPAPSPPPPAQQKTNTIPPPVKPEIDAETRRLQAMVEREQREREKAERAEQKRIKKMVEEEDKERRRREAEIAKETERLRKMYGVEGQDLPSDRPSLPPRTQPAPAPGSPQQQLGPWGHGPPPTLPPRPVSAGPQSRPQHSSSPTTPGPPPGQGCHGQRPPTHQSQHPQQQQQQQGQGPFHSNALNALWKGAAGGLHQLQNQGQRPPGRRKSEDEKAKVRKKRSSHW